MSETVIPYERNPKTKLVIYTDGSQEHEDKCPGCYSPIKWMRECEEWRVLADGTHIPSLMTAWHTRCNDCGSEFVCPYDDGLVYYVGGDYEDDE